MSMGAQKPECIADAVRRNEEDKQTAKLKVALYFGPSPHTSPGPLRVEALTWLLRRLAQIYSGQELMLLLQDAYEPRTVLSAQQDVKEWRIVRYTSPGMLSSLQEAVAKRGECDDTILVRLETVFSPIDAARALCSIRRPSGVHLLSISGLPIGVTPYRISPELLGLVADGERLSGKWDVESRLDDVLRGCGGLCQAMGLGSSPIQCVAPSSTETGLDVQPARIDFTEVGSLERLRRVTRDFAASEPDNKAMLRRWKEDLLKQYRASKIGLSGVSVLRQHLRPRVLFCSSMSGYAGGAEALCRVAEFLGPDYDQFALLGEEGRFCDALAAAGVDVRTVGREFIAPTPDAAEIIDATLKEIQPDIVHINEYSGILLPLMARLRGSFVVQHARCASFAPETVASMRFANRVLAVSHVVAATLHSADVPNDVITVLPDGVNIERRRPVTSTTRIVAKRRLGVHDDSLTILMIARYDRQKRHDVVIEAVARMRTRRSVKLLVVGNAVTPDDISWERQLRTLVDSLGLSSQTIWLPFTPNIQNVQEAADVSVLCSEREALGQVNIEAMAMGIPVVISRDGGLADYVRTSSPPAAFVIPHGDVNGLANALDILVHDEGLRAAYGASGRALVVEHFDVRHIARCLANIYSSLLHGSSSAVRQEVLEQAI